MLFLRWEWWLFWTLLGERHNEVLKNTFSKMQPDTWACDWGKKSWLPTSHLKSWLHSPVVFTWFSEIAVLKPIGSKTSMKMYSGLDQTLWVFFLLSKAQHSRIERFRLSQLLIRESTFRYTRKKKKKGCEQLYPLSPGKSLFILGMLMDHRATAVARRMSY